MKYLPALLLLCCNTSTSFAAVPVDITAASPTDVSVAPGATSAPFAVYVKAKDGTPVVGARVLFEVDNRCFIIPSPLSEYACPHRSYGRFETGNDHAYVVTDANGFAQSPRFVAGDVPTDYSAFAMVVSSATNVGEVGGLEMTSFFIYQRAPAHDGVLDPLNGSWTLGGSTGQGLFITRAKPGQVVGAFFTWTPAGEQRWFVLSSCPTECWDADEDDGYDLTAGRMFAVYAVTGGRPLEAAVTETRRVGTVEIKLTTCRTGTARFELPGAGPALDGKTVSITNLTPNLDC